MNAIFIVLGLFFALSLLSSILVLSAVVLSGRAGRTLQVPEPVYVIDETDEAVARRELPHDAALA